MNLNTEIEVLRSRLDALEEQLSASYAEPCTDDISHQLKRIDRMLRKRKLSTEEQIEYFQSLCHRDEEIGADCLSALNFEMAILNNLEDLLAHIMLLNG